MEGGLLRTAPPSASHAVYRGKLEVVVKVTDHRTGAVYGLARSIEISATTVVEQLARSVRRIADRTELRLAARRAALDPTAREFVERAKADVASGAIHDQLAGQIDLRILVQERGR